MFINFVSFDFTGFPDGFYGKLDMVVDPDYLPGMLWDLLHDIIILLININSHCELGCIWVLGESLPLVESGSSNKMADKIVNGDYNKPV